MVSVAAFVPLILRPVALQEEAAWGQHQHGHTTHAVPMQVPQVQVSTGWQPHGPRKDKYVPPTSSSGARPSSPSMFMVATSSSSSATPVTGESQTAGLPSLSGVLPETLLHTQPLVPNCYGPGVDGSQPLGNLRQAKCFLALAWETGGKREKASNWHGKTGENGGTRGKRGTPGEFQCLFPCLVVVACSLIFCHFVQAMADFFGASKCLFTGWRSLAVEASCLGPSDSERGGGGGIPGRGGSLLIWKFKQRPCPLPPLRSNTFLEHQDPALC